MTRNGGTMADPGSVAYNFTARASSRSPRPTASPRTTSCSRCSTPAPRRSSTEGGGFEVITEPSDLVAARTALQEAGIDYDSAEAEFVPNLKVEVDAETARKVFQLIDALEDSDDVQNIFGNFDIPAEVQAELEPRTRPSPCACSASTPA